MLKIKDIKIGNSSTRWVMFDEETLAAKGTAAIEHKFKYDIKY